MKLIGNTAVEIYELANKNGLTYKEKEVLIPFIMQAFDVERECNGLSKIWNICDSSRQ